MNVDIHTNLQPIVAGDEISISTHLDLWEKASTLGYGVAIAEPVQRTLAAFVPITSGFDFPWTVDFVAPQVVFQVTLYPVVHSAFSPVVTLNPAAAEIISPTDDELMHAGSPYTFRWNQTPPAPPSYRLRFSTDGAQTFPELGGDFPGNVDELTRNVPAVVTDQGLVRLEGLFTGFDPIFNPPIHVETTDQVLLHVGTPPPWQIGENGDVNWTVAGSVDHFKVELTRDGQSWTTLAASLPGSQRHLTVGVDPPATTHARVRVEAFAGGRTTTAVSGAFRIGAPPPRRGGHGPRD